MTDGRKSGHKKIVMDGQKTDAKFDAGSPGRQSKYWANERADGSTRKVQELPVPVHQRDKDETEIGAPELNSSETDYVAILLMERVQ